MNKLTELRAIPGLEAWSMRFPKNEDGTTSLDSDYVAKFGEAGKDDNHYTFKNGMALLCTNATWNDNWMRSECKVNWDYWPYPRMDENTPVYTPIHVDCAYLTSTCAEPQVAFQLLKWLTYGVEGNLQRLDIFAARGDAQAAEGDTKLLKTWFIPCTQNPDVLAKFEENPHLTEGFKALYRSTANSIRGDLNKILPGYSAIFTDEVNALINSVRNGEASAADVGPQIDALSTPRCRLLARSRESAVSLLAQRIGSNNTDGRLRRPPAAPEGGNNRDGNDEETDLAVAAALLSVCILRCAADGFCVTAT